MTTLDADVREAILEGCAVTLMCEPDGSGWYARIEGCPWSIQGRSAGEVYLNLADLLSAPINEGTGLQ